MIHIGLRNQKQSPTEVLEYIKQRAPIPLHLFYKYHDKYACRHKVLFTCQICNSDGIDSWDNLNNRIKLYNNICCKKCSYIYSTCLRENIPSELIPYYFNKKPVPFALYLKHKDCNANKLRVECHCEQCGSYTTTGWNISVRQHSPEKQICRKCIWKYTSNLDIVKQRNSAAQIIAQNTPESKEKNRLAQLKRYALNPESFKKINKLYIVDKEIQSIERLKYGHLRGYYNNIKFDSSWELSILVRYEYETITRCDLKIPYVVDDKLHMYFPDFILNNEFILEVKGRKHEINDIKKNATIKYLYENNINLKYKILYYEDLKMIDNIKLFKSVKDLNLLDQNKLKIVRYPKTWKK